MLNISEIRFICFWKGISVPAVTAFSGQCDGFVGIFQTDIIVNAFVGGDLEKFRYPIVGITFLDILAEMYLYG